MHAYIHPPPHTCTLVVDCGAPLSVSIIAVYNSTLEGSVLEFSCREDLLSSDVIAAVCSPDGMWTPDPNMHTCKSTTSGIVLVSVYNINVELRMDLGTRLIILLY